MLGDDRVFFLFIVYVDHLHFLHEQIFHYSVLFDAYHVVYYETVSHYLYSYDKSVPQKLVPILVNNIIWHIFSLHLYNCIKTLHIPHTLDLNKSENCVCFIWIWDRVLYTTYLGIEPIRKLLFMHLFEIEGVLCFLAILSQMFPMIQF